MSLPLEATEGEELWRRKFVALKKRCKDYQQMNAMLFLRVREVHKIILKAEAETRYLVKKLEQYEEVDFPKCLPSTRAAATGLILPSPHPLHVPTPHPLILTAAATRIRAEVEAALSVESDQSNDSNGTQQELSSPKHRPDKLTVAHSNSTTVPPQSTVIQGPSSLIPIPSPVSVPERTVFGPPKTKRIKRTIKSMPEKPSKSTGKGSAGKRRKGDVDPNAPKKPSNAFFWFCQAKRAELQEQFKGEVTTGQHDLTKALAKLWGETPADDKKVFYEQYTLDKARYDQEMDAYLKSKQAANQIADDNIATPEV